MEVTDCSSRTSDPTDQTRGSRKLARNRSLDWGLDRGLDRGLDLGLDRGLDLGLDRGHVTHRHSDETAANHTSNLRTINNGVNREDLPSRSRELIVGRAHRKSAKKLSSIIQKRNLNMLTCLWFFHGFSPFHCNVLVLVILHTCYREAMRRKTLHNITIG